MGLEGTFITWSRVGGHPAAARAVIERHPAPHFATQVPPNRGVRTLLHEGAYSVSVTSSPALALQWHPKGRVFNRALWWHPSGLLVAIPLPRPKETVAKYKALQHSAGAGWQALVKEGRAGTAAYRVGGNSWCGRKRRRPSSAAPFKLRKVLALMGAADIAQGREVQQRSDARQGAHTGVGMALCVQLATDEAQARAIDTEDELRELALRKWGTDFWASAQNRDMGVFQHFQSSDGVHAVSSVGPNFTAMYWPPPASTLAKHALAKGGNTSLRADLLNAWTTRHAPLERDKLPKCEVPSAPMLQVTTCFKAGRCLCEDGTGKGAKALLPHAFRAILLRLFKKGQPHKGLYNRGIAFVNIFKLREGQGTGLWFHLGMENLRSGLFTLTPLRHHRTLENAVAELNYHIEDGPLSMYEALLDTVTTADDWDMELLLADLDDTELVAADFVPNKVRVTPIKPPEVHALWRQCRQVVGRGRNLPIRGLPHARPPAIEDGAEQEAQAS